MALNFNGQMWVLGGAEFAHSLKRGGYLRSRANTWSLGPSMLTARRNAAMDTNGTSHIWLAGGYDDTGVANSYDGNLEPVRDAYTYPNSNRNTDGYA